MKYQWVKVGETMYPGAAVKSVSNSPFGWTIEFIDGTRLTTQDPVSFFEVPEHE
jgi:hypothetical protein